MKTLKIATFIIISFLSVKAQNLATDSLGNFYAITRTIAHDSTTGKTYTNSKGVVYQVYQGTRGGLYYGVTSRTGKYYRRYLKID